MMNNVAPIQLLSFPVCGAIRFYVWCRILRTATGVAGKESQTPGYRWTRDLMGRTAP